MYCPQCGQQQTSDQVRFCSRCGFQLEAVSAVLAGGGLPPRYVQPGPQQLSPRSKGVRQGALLMLSTLFIVPVMAIVLVGILDGPEELVALAAVTCFVGGLLRMIYALLMEDAYPQVNNNQVPTYAPPAPQQFGQPSRNVALPPASVNNTSNWRRPTTSELVRPPSVTENTTRLLDKDDPNNR